MNSIQFWIGLLQTGIGAIAGAWIGAWFATLDARRNFKEERADILKALLGSLNKNVHYINQMEGDNFPKGEIPTFPFDTVALAHITLHSRKYLPKGANWAEHYNGLRFELDHINRKLLMYSFNKQPDQLNSIKTLITDVKSTLESEIDTLSKVIPKN